MSIIYKYLKSRALSVTLTQNIRPDAYAGTIFLTYFRFFGKLLILRKLIVGHSTSKINYPSKFNLHLVRFLLALNTFQQWKLKLRIKECIT